MTLAPTPFHQSQPRQRSHALPLLAALLLGVAAGVLLTNRHSDGSSGSAIDGSGRAATQTRTVASFTGIELAGSNVVTVTVGEARSVIVRADSNVIDHVQTVVHDGRLVVDNDRTFSSETPLAVNVTVPALDRLDLSGSGVIAASGIDARKLTVSLSGSGVLRLNGTARQVDVTLHGSGDAQLDGLVAHGVNAVVAGSGRVLVHATDWLHASVPGTGAIVYTGDPPVITRNVTGSGAVVAGS